MADKEQKRILSLNLKRELTKKGKQQKEAARELGVGLTTFNNWCAGYAVPSLDMLQKLAGYFGCRLTDLVDEWTPEKEQEARLALYIQKLKALSQDNQRRVLERIDVLTELEETQNPRN